MADTRVRINIQYGLHVLKPDSSVVVGGSKKRKSVFGGNVKYVYRLIISLMARVFN